MRVSGSKPARIDGKRVFLRLLGAGDATPEYCGWLCDPQVNLYLDTKGSTLGELKKYIKEKENSPKDFLYGIFCIENGAHIGNVKLELEPASGEGKKANIGIMIGSRAYWGKGLAAEALRTLSSWALESLALDEIWAGILPENTASVRAFGKAGFSITEGQNKTGPGGVLRKVVVARLAKKESA